MDLHPSAITNIKREILTIIRKITPLPNNNAKPWNLGGWFKKMYQIQSSSTNQTTIPPQRNLNHLKGLVTLIFASKNAGFIYEKTWITSNGHLCLSPVSWPAQGFTYCLHPRWGSCWVYRHNEFLQQKGYLEKHLEDVILEPLQGVEGLKALRVSVKNLKIDKSAEVKMEEINPPN